MNKDNRSKKSSKTAREEEKYVIHDSNGNFSWEEFDMDRFFKDAKKAGKIIRGKEKDRVNERS